MTNNFSLFLSKLSTKSVDYILPYLNTLELFRNRNNLTTTSRNLLQVAFGEQRNRRYLYALLDDLVEYGIIEYEVKSRNIEITLKCADFQILDEFVPNLYRTCTEVPEGATYMNIKHLEGVVRIDSIKSVPNLSRICPNRTEKAEKKPKNKRLTLLLVIKKNKQKKISSSDVEKSLKMNYRSGGSSSDKPKVISKAVKNYEKYKSKFEGAWSFYCKNDLGKVQARGAKSKAIEQFNKIPDSEVEKLFHGIACAGLTKEHRFRKHLFSFIRDRFYEEYEELTIEEAKKLASNQKQSDIKTNNSNSGVTLAKNVIY